MWCVRVILDRARGAPSAQHPTHAATGGRPKGGDMASTARRTFPKPVRTKTRSVVESFFASPLAFFPSLLSVLVQLLHCPPMNPAPQSATHHISSSLAPQPPPAPREIIWFVCDAHLAASPPRASRPSCLTARALGISQHQSEKKGGGWLSASTLHIFSDGSDSDSDSDDESKEGGKKGEKVNKKRVPPTQTVMVRKMAAHQGRAIGTVDRNNEPGAQAKREKRKANGDATPGSEEKKPRRYRPPRRARLAAKGIIV